VSSPPTPPPSFLSYYKNKTGSGLLTFDSQVDRQHLLLRGTRACAKIAFNLERHFAGPKTRSST